MISFKPTKAARKNIQNITMAEDIFRQGVRNALFDMGKDAALRSGELINNEGRTGRVYFVNGTAHTASAPGEPPANRTGKLKKSMNYIVRGESEVEWGAQISYAKFLELGTRRMAARPFLQDVLDRQGSNHATYLGQRVKDAIKRRS